MLLLMSVFILNLTFDTPKMPTASVQLQVTEGGQLYPLDKGFTQTQPFQFALQPSDHQLAFVLKEFNANCLHNGEIKLTFEDLKHALNQPSSMQRSIEFETTYQLTQQTCAYETLDWNGQVTVNVSPLETQRPPWHEVSAQSLNEAPWQPQPEQAQPTVFGWAKSDSDGKLIAHYSNRPNTAIPAYSLSKTFVAATAALLIKKMSSTPVLDRSISDLVNQCTAASWQNVTLDDALNMQTGHYDNASHHADESSAAMIQRFFLSLSHQEKISHACNYSHQASADEPPFVYQTSATYLLATALQTGLAQDSFSLPTSTKRLDTLLYQTIWPRLQLSPLAYSIDSTKDARRQVWGGFGLSLLPQDLVALAQFVQHDPMELGFAEILARPDLAIPVPGNPQLRYRASVWFWHDKENDRWYPFLSGYGGIMVLFLDQHHLYYLVSDQHDHRFRQVLRDFQRWQRELAP